MLAGTNKHAQARASTRKLTQMSYVNTNADGNTYANTLFQFVFIFKNALFMCKYISVYVRVLVCRFTNLHLHICIYVSIHVYIC